MARITPEQARTYLGRWQVAGEPSGEEPRPTSLETKLRQLEDLAKWLETANIPAVIVGGLAVSLLGRPRFTRDIDVLALITERDWRAAIAAAADHGIVPRLDKPLEFALRTRLLALEHAESSIGIDVTLGSLPFEREAVEHGQVHGIGDVSVRLPRVQDLLILKALAHRPQDMQDIAALLEAHPQTDVEPARQWVREFATATGTPDLVRDLERVLEKGGSPKVRSITPAIAAHHRKGGGAQAATLVCRAIRSRSLLQFHYKGQRRVVAPYCHGISTRGVEVLRAIQVGGASRSGGPRIGKLWALDEMVDIQVMDQTFTPDDPQYNPNDTAMKKVHCCV